jgi:hypothetical protein
MAKKASRISKKLSNPNTPALESDEAYMAVYNALRQTQDEGLISALGEGARGVRQGIALNKVLERTAGNRALQMEGSHPIGLIGAMELPTALGLLATGHPIGGATVAAHALLGKATAPLRANLLTTAMSKAQYVPKVLSKTAMPLLVGGELGGQLGSRMAVDSEGTPLEPTEPPPEVARRIFARTLKGK